MEVTWMFLLFLLRASFVKSTDVKRQLGSDTDLKDLVEKFIAKALKVVDNNDPYQIDRADFNYNSYGVMSVGFVEQVVLSFQSTTEIKNLIVDRNGEQLDFGFDLSLSKFQVTGANSDWNFTMLTLLNVTTSKTFGMLLSGLEVEFRSKLDEMEDKVLTFTDLDLKVSVDSGKVSIGSLFGNPKLGEFTAGALSDTLAPAINSYPQVFTALSFLAKFQLNSLLQQYNVTLDQVIDVMQHFIM